MSYLGGRPISISISIRATNTPVGYTYTTIYVLDKMDSLLKMGKEVYKDFDKKSKKKDKKKPHEYHDVCNFM